MFRSPVWNENRALGRKTCWLVVVKWEFLCFWVNFIPLDGSPLATQIGNFLLDFIYINQAGVLLGKQCYTLYKRKQIGLTSHMETQAITHNSSLFVLSLSLFFFSPGDTLRVLTAKQPKETRSHSFSLKKLLDESSKTVPFFSFQNLNIVEQKTNKMRKHIFNPIGFAGWAEHYISIDLTYMAKKTFWYIFYQMYSALTECIFK